MHAHPNFHVYLPECIHVINIHNHVILHLDICVHDVALQVPITYVSPGPHVSVSYQVEQHI